MSNQAPLISINAISFARDQTRILENCSAAIEPGKHYHITGANGSGKSTLLRILAGITWPDPNTGSRTYTIHGTSTQSPLAVKPFMRLISPETQERFLRLRIPLTIAEFVASGINDADYLTDVSPSNAALRDRLLAELHLTAAAERLVIDASHGTVRRAALARALIAEPAILFLDEALDGLDESSLALAKSALHRRVAKRDLTIVATSHRAHTLPLPEQSMRTYEIREKHLFEIANASNPVSPIDEMAANPVSVSLPPNHGTLSGSAATNNLAANKTAIGVAAADDTAIGVAAADDTASGNPTVESAAIKESSAYSSNAALIELENISVQFDETIALRNISLAVHPGAHFAITGANGSGKSTLAGVLQGTVPVASGTAMRLNRSRRLSIWELKRRIVVLSDAVQLRADRPDAVHDVITAGILPLRGPNEPYATAEIHRVDQIMHAFDLSNVANKNYLSLSFGTRRFVLIARALINDPEIIILDETFDGLDTARRAMLTAELHRRAEFGCTIIVISHEPELIPDFVTGRVHLDTGRIRPDTGLIARSLAHEPGVREPFPPTPNLVVT